MIRTLARPFVLASLLLALSACDSGAGQSNFFEDAYATPNGYTRVPECGQPDPNNVDEDDWRVAPIFEGNVAVDPACPNPVARDGLVSITVTDLFDDRITGGVYAIGFNETGTAVRLAEDFGQGPTYFLAINAANLRLVGGDAARLYRVIVLDGASNVVTYGDVLVE